MGVIGEAVITVAVLAFVTFLLWGDAIIFLVAVRMTWRQINREAALLPQPHREAYFDRKHAELDASFKKKK